MKILITYSLFLLISGCATHIYKDDGSCLTCFNNPLTLEPVNYDVDTSKRDKNNIPRKEYLHSPLLSNHELALFGLSRFSQQQDIPYHEYSEDYLRYIARNNFSNIKRNEFDFYEAKEKAKIQLINDVDQFELKGLYQITLPVELGDYDFSTGEFPMRELKSFTLRDGPGQLNNLPNYVSVYFSNYKNIPNLKMAKNDAKAFLEARKLSKYMYLRYIVKVIKMNSLNSFVTEVVKVQYIDKRPSIITRDNKEKFLPFRTSSVKSGSNIF